jgi:predicted ATP-grasp superfamily ATP-dependent carboligase
MYNTNTKSFSVLIPDGDSPHALEVIRCLGSTKNVKSYILSDKSFVPIRFSRYSSKFISYETPKNDKDRLAAIHNAVEKIRPDIILPVDCRTIRLLSANSENLLEKTMISPLPSTEAFDIANNKWLLADWLKNNQIPCPPTILYQRNSTFDKELLSISFPVLIKPILESSGRGIKLFNNSTELYSYCKNQINSGEYIIQSFINGYDIDFSILCMKGKILAYTIQKGFEKSSRQFKAPPGIDFLFDNNTYKVVTEMAEKLNWTGVVHIDLRYDEKDQQVKVIELNPRFWGSVIGSSCAGVNFPYLACLIGLKRELPKIVVKPTRFVSGKIAVKVLAKKLFTKNKQGLFFDNTILEFYIKDPLPVLLAKYPKLYKIFYPKK